MRQRKTTTIHVVILCCSMGIVFGQAPAFDVRKVVKEVSAKCEAAKEYAFEGDLVLVGQRGSAPGQALSQAKVKLAMGREGRLFLHVRPLNKDEYMLLSDGQKSWAYVPKLKKYTEEESAVVEGDSSEEKSSDREGQDLAETFSREVMPMLARLEKTAEAMDIHGTGEVKYDGTKVSWPVVRVVSREDKQDGRSLTELTIDPETLRIGRMMWGNVTQKGGEKLVLRLTVNFSSFKVGQSLPDASFTFTPPKNAKLVEALPISGQPASLLVNHPAPDFKLKTLEGEVLQLSSLRGRPVLLTFWASWCGPCRRELPELAELHAQFKDKGLVVLGVNDEGKGTARKYVDKAGLPFTVIDDAAGKAHGLYHVRSIPTAFLIDREGKVVRFLNGGRDQATLRAALKSVGL